LASFSLSRLESLVTLLGISSQTLVSLLSVAGSATLWSPNTATTFSYVAPDQSASRLFDSSHARSSAPLVSLCSRLSQSVFSAHRRVKCASDIALHAIHSTRVVALRKRICDQSTPANTWITLKNKTGSLCHHLSPSQRLHAPIPALCENVPLTARSARPLPILPYLPICMKLD